jgi:flagellar motor switch protein FliM
MSTMTEQTPAERQRAEAKALDKIAERVAAQFPELSTQRIVDSIHVHFSEFDGVRVRDFIPVLVERAVKADLTRI